MKTRNSKLQKSESTFLNNLIVLIAAVMILNAQSTASERAIIRTTGAEIFAEVLVNDRDAELSIEKWMLNKSNFFHIYELEAANEASLELESWMTDAINFSASNSLEKVTEEALNLTEWMLNESNFSPVFSLETEIEESMALENWMMDIKSFDATFSLENESEEVLNVEEWMLNENNFYASPALETEMDNILKLEAWMLSDTLFSRASSKETKTETLAMTSTEKTKSFTTVEYKDAESGVTFLFRLTETKDPELQLENWMIDTRYWDKKLKTK